MAGFSLGNMFRPTQQVSQVQATPQPQGPAQGSPQGQQDPGSTMQQNNPAAGAGTGEQQAGQQQQPPSSPLDAFKDVWKTPDNGGATPPADPFSQPLFNSDPAKITEAAGKADFLSAIPQELMQKAMSGQDPQAFMQVINKVGQQALAMSVQLATATVEQAGTRIGDRYKQDVPNRFKDFQLNNLPASNPALQHPAAEPMLKTLRNQIRQNEPTLRPEEINAKAESFLAAFANQLTSKQSDGQSQQTQTGEPDWESWAR